MYGKALVHVGSRPITEEVMMAMLEDKELSDKLLNWNKGDHEDISSNEKVLVEEEEYQGEQEIIYQTQEDFSPRVSKFTEVLDRVLKNQFPKSSKAYLMDVDKGKKDEEEKNI